MTLVAKISTVSLLIALIKIIVIVVAFRTGSICMVLRLHLVRSGVVRNISEETRSVKKHILLESIINKAFNDPIHACFIWHVGILQILGRVIQVQCKIDFRRPNFRYVWAFTFTVIVRGNLDRLFFEFMCLNIGQPQNVLQNYGKFTHVCPNEKLIYGSELAWLYY